MKPGYLKLFQTGELTNRIIQANTLLKQCTLCPQNCEVDRTKSSTGICGTGNLVPVSSYGAHFGEEAPLVGQFGSGTIFFASCNLLCLFCQNYEISHFKEENAHLLSCEELAAIMLDLQQQGCHNINLVTPSHVVPQILAALPFAIKGGFTLPLVYNSSGYDAYETLELLDGMIDIYMPDFKFWSSSTAKRYTSATDYPERARAAITTMFAQVGNLVVDEHGIAVRGLLIRHLVMPGHIDETFKILDYIAKEISAQCHVNIMDQYRPCGKAIAPIDRPLQTEEYKRAIAFADSTRLRQLNKKSS